MMEPLTVIGALASAAQLFDMSLKYSYRACNFVSALKHSEEHAALLHQSTFTRISVAAVGYLAMSSVLVSTAVS